MDQSAKFWDRWAERYSKRQIADEAAYQKKLHITREHFRPDMTVLEFGCGTGSTALAHAPHVQHIQAIDSSANMLDIARKKARAEHIENITFSCSSIDTFTAPDSSFDAVLGLSILHLLENKEAVMAKVLAMLKPGGVFVTSTVCLGDTMKFFKIIAPIGRFVGLMPLLKVFSKAELVASVSAAGFLIDYEWQPNKSPTIFIVAKKPE